MKYYDIKEKLSSIKVFSPEDILIIDPGFRIETLYDWVKDERVTKLRNKKYIFSDYIPANYELYYVANKLYEPSYISLELALNHYGIIPEAVARITSVTTKKTFSIDTRIGGFDYKTIDESLFFDYKMIQSEDIVYKVASLEKTLIDYFYLNTIDSLDMLESLRFNRHVLQNELDIKRLTKHVEESGIVGISKKIDLLKEFIKL